MSTVVTLSCPLTSSMTLSAVALLIVSVRFGELSTWQWEHAWLQYRPMFSCTVSGERLINAN